MASIGGKSKCIINSFTGNTLTNIVVLRVPEACTDYVRGDDGYWYKDNEVVSGDMAERLNKMGIPPAWRNVVVAADLEQKVQAIGLDAAGRWQYRYSAEHVVAAARKKFDRVKSFSRDMSTVRRGMDDGISAGDPRAYALRLEDQTAIRAGSRADFKARKKAYGLTTLEKRHVRVRGDKIRLNFTAKEGIEAEYELTDSTLARWLEGRMAQLEDADQIFYDVPARRLNEYLRELADNKSYSIKDFRTYHGTRLAQEEIQKYAGEAAEGLTKKRKKEIVKEVSTKVSNFLKNTPAMAKNSYIDPMVWDYIGGLP